MAGASPHGLVLAPYRGYRRRASAFLDRAITLYDPAEHRPLATRFGQDVGAATLSWKSLAFWLLGYPQAALADSEHALKIAREIGHSATLMYVLNFSAWAAGQESGQATFNLARAAKIMLHQINFAAAITTPVTNASVQEYART
jgi:hypothetical protein